MEDATQPPIANGATPRMGPIERLSWYVFKWVTILVLPSIVVIVTADTILRYVFSAPTVWSHDAVGVGMFLMFTGCLAHAWNADVHVRLSMFYAKFPHGWQRAVDWIGSLCALCLSALLTYRAAVVAVGAYHSGMTTPSGVIPLAPVAALAALFCLLFTLAVVSAIVSSRVENPAQ